MNLPTVLAAVEFMVRAHGKQPRKYTGEPYAVHPACVARMVAEKGAPEHAVIAALLHDVLEDTLAKPSEIHTLFGADVLDLVLQVTDVSRESDGNRAMRKGIDREHYAKASPWGQSIKLADMIDNTRTILLHDSGFAAIYMVEKRELLKVLTRGHSDLYRDAKRTVDEYFAAELRRGHASVG